MFNSLKNNVLVELIQSASLAIQALSAEGVAVKSVTLASNKPVIRVKPCGYCEKQIKSGHAVYLEFGCSMEGRYRQGHFYTNGCKVIWSESLH